MRVALVGLGSIGRRHLANVRALEPDAEIVVVRHSRSDEPVPAGADRVVYDLDDVASLRPDIAFICGPTTMHVPAGIRMIEMGAHLFVEKPLAASYEDAGRLVEAADRSGKLVFVGYNLRFLPSLQRLQRSLAAGEIGTLRHVSAGVGQYLPDWRPGTDHRAGNSARADFGGGIEFELSHELDYTSWLAGPARALSAMIQSTSDLGVDGGDCADIALSYASGAGGNIHLDMTERAATRTCRLVGSDGTLLWDGIAGTVDRFRAGEGWQRLHDGDGDRNAMYCDEARHVFACLRGEEVPSIDARQALDVVRIASAVRRSSEEGRRIDL